MKGFWIVDQFYNIVEISLKVICSRKHWLRARTKRYLIASTVNYFVFIRTVTTDESFIIRYFTCWQYLPFCDKTSPRISSHLRVYLSLGPGYSALARLDHSFPVYTPSLHSAPLLLKISDVIFANSKHAISFQMIKFPRDMKGCYDSTKENYIGQTWTEEAPGSASYS